MFISYTDDSRKPGLRMSNVAQMLEKALNSSFLPFFFFVFLFLHYKWLFSYSSKIRNIPPSPKHKLPIIGHLHKLGMQPHRCFQSLSIQHGELMLIYLGNKPTIIVSSARVAKMVMKTHDAVFSNRPKFSINDKLLYNSRDVSASPYGEYWRQMKSICVLHLLSNRRVQSYRDICEEETALLIEKIRQNYNSDIVSNLSEMFVVLTNDVVCRVAFGRKCSENQQDGVDFKEVLKEFVELLGMFNIGDFIPWLKWINEFNGMNKRLMKVAKRFDLLLEEIIMQHMDQLNQTENCSDGEYNNKAKDFVDALLKFQKENLAGFTLERESVKALILDDVFAAGTNTTYAVLEWAMAELLRTPEIMEKLQNEVREIAGEKDHLTEDDFENMKYLKAVIKETLRLHPPVPLLVPRESTQDLILNGYDISARTLVFVNAWAIQRDPDVWDNPEHFIPEVYAFFYRHQRDGP